MPRCISLGEDGRSAKVLVKPIPNASESNIAAMSDKYVEIELNGKCFPQVSQTLPARVIVYAPQLRTKKLSSMPS